MRLSAYLGDPGYELWYRLQKERRLPDIFLDGQPIRNVLVPDEELGMVRVFVTDENDCPLRDPKDPERLQTRVHRGRVRIKIKDPK